MRSSARVATPKAPEDATAIAVQTAIEHHKAGRLQQAAQLYEQVLRADPNNVGALHLMGRLGHQMGKHDFAVDLIQRAVAIKPDEAIFHCSLGNALNAAGRKTEAIESYGRAIAIKPDEAIFHNSLGNTLNAAGRTTEAIESYEKAIAIDPKNAGAHNNLGLVCRDLERIDEALEQFRTAIDLDPTHVGAHNNMALTLTGIGQPDGAIELYEKALTLKTMPFGVYSNLLMAMNYSTRYTAEEVYERHRNFAKICEREYRDLTRPHHVDRSADRRLRIGYLSPDFRQHSVAHFIEPVLRHHDHGQFDIYCYYNSHIKDSVTKSLIDLSDQWRDIVGTPDAGVINTIREDQIDILVDLCGHTSFNRLTVFACKPAPVQVTWLGYPNTTGLSTIDYRITDAVADPPGASDRYCSETLYRLPECFSVYQPPDPCPTCGPLPARDQGFVTFGSFNNMAKVTRPTIELWSRLLKTVPGSRLVLKFHGLGVPSLQRTVCRAFAEFGIDAGRLELLGKDESQAQHLLRYHLIDIALDPFPYSGTTTTCDALWMGVPVITLAGQVHATRVGVSQLSSLGHADLIAGSEDQYVEIARKLATDLDRLDAIRNGLRRRMAESPLMDYARFTHNLENAYREMWKKWRESGVSASA